MSQWVHVGGGGEGRTPGQTREEEEETAREATNRRRAAVGLLGFLGAGGWGARRGLRICTNKPGLRFARNKSSVVHMTGGPAGDPASPNSQGLDPTPFPASGGAGRGAQTGAGGRDPRCGDGLFLGGFFPPPRKAKNNVGATVRSNKPNRDASGGPWRARAGWGIRSWTIFLPHEMGKKPSKVGEAYRLGLQGSWGGPKPPRLTRYGRFFLFFFL